MTIHEMERLAQEIAIDGHKGQLDKAGRPYIEHVERVVKLVFKYEPEVRIVGWLHDVVEDTPYTVENVRRIFGSHIAASVALLTRNKALPYDMYIRGIHASQNEWARIVKTADLLDHIQQPGCPESLRPRYVEALLTLSGAPLR